MSKDTFTFDDIDDILADFYKSYNEAEKKEAELKAAHQAKAPATKSTYNAAIDFSGAAEKLRRQTEEVKSSHKAGTVAVNQAPSPRSVNAAAHKPEGKSPAKEEKQYKHAAPAEKHAARSSKAGSSFEEFEALFPGSAKKEDKIKGHSPLHSRSSKAGRDEIKEAAAEPKAKKAKAEKLPKAKAEKPAKAVKAEKPALDFAEAAPVQQAPRKKFSLLHTLLSLIFACVSALALVWVLFNVHPASGTVSTAGDSAVLKLSDKLDVYMNNVASDALGELSYIKKIYTLQESDTVAPVPNPDGFGVTRDVAVIQDVIKRAAPLLEGQSVVFDPNADFVPDTDFMYYLDDTIMVIAWKEYINERCCTMAEVKIAHGSQLRRKLAEDSYSSSVQYYASDMANASNAVIAINGDFYAFRDLGITVYQRKLYRNNPAAVDSCFFTADGNMLFSRAGELMGEGETQQFIEDNDVLFAVAFGPVLVENGELQYCASYPIGEINTEYSRSCIAMTDNLHYLLMTINHTPDARPRATINDLARYIYSKGVINAYTLDGGQTAEIVMMGGPINHVDFGFERTVSDIIYFATAIPNEEVSQ